MGETSPGEREGSPESLRDPVEVPGDATARRRRNLAWLTAAVVAVAVGAGLLTYWGAHRPDSGRKELAAQVTTYGNLSRNHTTDSVTYPQSPPVGGDHAPVWLNCGNYDQPVRNEYAVHSMEHGAVWVTYNPDLSAADVATLRSEMPSTYVILSPYEGLDAPVVATAWGVQLALTGVDDPRLKTFLDVYRRGSQTPEPGARCDGGTGTPTG